MWRAAASGPLLQRRWPWVLSTPHLGPRYWLASFCMPESRCDMYLADVLCTACSYLVMTCLFYHWLSARMWCNGGLRTAA